MAARRRSRSGDEGGCQRWWGRAGGRLGWFGPLVTVAGKGGWLCDGGGDDGDGMAVPERKEERKRRDGRRSRRRWLATSDGSWRRQATTVMAGRYKEVQD
ncbi:hypothetical protein Droror1_Dr00008912 [Drosera rotundifolia]